MKGTEAFKATIQNHLNEKAANDELFAATLKKENKSIDECIDYIIGEAKNWSTPRVGGQESYETRLQRGKDMGLQGEVEFYGMKMIDGHQDQDNLSTNGSNREQLNPAWVAQLMGTTLEKTFYAPMAIQ